MLSGDACKSTIMQTFDDQQLFAETFGIVFLTGLCIPMIIFAKYYEGTGARLGPASST